MSKHQNVQVEWASFSGEQIVIDFQEKQKKLNCVFNTINSTMYPFTQQVWKRRNSVNLAGFFKFLSTYQTK